MKHQHTRKTIKPAGKETPIYEKIFVGLSMAFFTAFPFLARLVVMRVSESEQTFFSTQNGLISDVALYSKEIAIAAFAAIAVLFFIGERIFTDKPEPLNRDYLKKLKVPLALVGVMTLFAALSFAFSAEKEVAWRGVFTEYEGFLALLSYVIVFMFGLYYLRKGDCVEFFKHFAVVVSIIAGVLCCIELFYKPILEFRFIQHLISSEKYTALAESIESRYFTGQSALLFNNPGFLGGFAALLLPIDIALAVEAKNKPIKVARIVAAALISVALYGSDSKAAWVSLLVTVPLMSFFMIRNSKDRKSGLIVLGITLAAVVAVFAITGVAVRAGLKEDEGQSSVTGQTGELFKLDKAELKDGVLYFTSGEDTLVCSVDSDRFFDYDHSYVDEIAYVDCIVLKDGEGRILDRQFSRFDNDRVELHLEGVAPKDPRFDMITVATEGQMVYFCFGYEGPAQFAMFEEGFKSFAQEDILEDSIPQPAVTGFESLYGFGTGRGYIWVQSLPVMKDSLLLGKGCGNFVFNFRQNELVGLLNTHGSMKYVIDRPHNWYLQVFVSNGLPFLICMLVLFAIIVIKGIRLAIRKEAGAFELGLLAGVLTFMITGLINDSCVTVNPLFWLVLGLTARRILLGGMGSTNPAP
ncbi:MAG: O-antigen ligase family protein [Lachnospiraceae bacterium]|nr:O-antigen ligase family protein [Lachnospiraceae bacterium]